MVSRWPNCARFYLAGVQTKIISHEVLVLLEGAYRLVMIFAPTSIIVCRYCPTYEAEMLLLFYHEVGTWSLLPVKSSFRY
jgi:hypothetical protein